MGWLHSVFQVNFLFAEASCKHGWEKRGELNYYSCIIYASVNPTYIRIRGGRRQEGKNEGKKGKEGKRRRGDD